MKKYRYRATYIFSDVRTTVPITRWFALYSENGPTAEELSEAAKSAMDPTYQFNHLVETRIDAHRDNPLHSGNIN